jgi:GNAT superfamily N-acetyltransferase
VGSLWIGPHGPDRADAFWVWDVEIDAPHRGRGLGRAAMLLAEEAARAHGATELGLNVFGPNTVARHLYDIARLRDDLSHHAEGARVEGPGRKVLAGRAPYPAPTMPVS